MKRRPTYRSAMWHPRHMAILVARFLALTVFPLPQAAAQESIEAAATGALGKGWSSFYDSQPFSAAEAVDKLARSSNLGTKLHALHVKARSLWLAGDPASQRAAQSLWTELAREGQGDPYSRARTEIARGLGFEKSGQAAQAIESIEQITKQNLPSCVAVEAAIELALLYAHADRVRDATAQLDEADTILGYPESIALPGELQKAFAKGVKHARESIASKGHALFLLARGMQREKQYPRAIELFNQVSQDFPASDYAPRSQCEVGACLVSMGRQDEAIEHWRAFIAAAPAGPWRGQAFLRLIDIQLAERLRVYVDPQASDAAKGFVELIATCGVASASAETDSVRAVMQAYQKHGWLPLADAAIQLEAEAVISEAEARAAPPQPGKSKRK